ncbi:hypothetical protein, partial [Streptomyces calidiresistens]|uniref:hypothetical protein n=1 Tax=Streptomyces calidiresistens TaxID=1485586 RepID=UPI001E351773
RQRRTHPPRQPIHRDNRPKGHPPTWPWDRAARERAWSAPRSPVPDPGGRTPLLDIERYPAAVPTNPGSPGIERTHAYRDRE